MDGFRIKYGELTKDLTEFVELLANRFKVGEPPALKNVKLIPSVLTLEDRDLVTGNVKEVLCKYDIVQRYARMVLKFVTPFVDEKHKEWLENQISTLGSRITVVDGCVQKINDGGKYDVVSPATIDGSGGTNRRMPKGLSYDTVKKLNEMWQVFREHNDKPRL